LFRATRGVQGNRAAANAELRRQQQLLAATDADIRALCEEMLDVLEEMANPEIWPPTMASYSKARVLLDRRRHGIGLLKGKSDVLES